MFTVLVVAAPVFFVLLTTVAILSFAPVEEEPETQLNLEQPEDGAKIILFRPALLRAESSSEEIVATLEQELRQRQQTAQKIVAGDDKQSAAAS